MSEEKKIACEVCKKIIPKAAAIHPEGKEYVLYFCSTECMNYWEEEKKEEESK
jgi:YHS domain-containing protein